MKILYAALASTLLTAAPGMAQPPGSPSDPGQKAIRMIRTLTPPTIDGVLDEAAWESAAVIDDLHQTSPIEYAEPYERTEVFILYDEVALYVAARLYDPEPELITAQNLRQNDNINSDDGFYFHIDPFNDRRSGYYFGVNPNGVRQDGIYQYVTDFYDAWDGIFHAAAGRFDEGWIAEMEIPLKTISFDPNTDTWGMNFTRAVRRKNETSAWVSRNRQFNPSASGLAVGFEGLQQGIGLDITPSISANQTRLFNDHQPGASDPRDTTDSDVEPSLDLVYKLTPSLNGSLTINTDFSATEVDDRQVNLTRFGLFFPEKRDFFLRESDIFEFGGIGGSRQSSIPEFNALAQNGRPFFSRRIGLSGTGDIVDLDYGAKISGRVGRWEIGALSIRQDEFKDVSASTLSVMRAKLNVLSESSIGVIATDGNPTSNLDNSVAGFDFQYRNTRLPGGRALEAQAWYQQSDTEGLVGEDSAKGLAVQLPSASGIRAAAEIKEFETNFNPALGFETGNGLRDSSASMGYMHRLDSGKYLQSILFSLTTQRIENINGDLITDALFLIPFELNNRTGDRVSMGYRARTEVLTEPFSITPDPNVSPILPGRYAVDDIGIQMSTGNHRKLAGNMRYVHYLDGKFYGGNRSDYHAAVTWRPSPRFRTSLSYTLRDIELPQGRFDVRQTQAGFDVIFSSTLSWVNLIQYDDISETMGINMRLHWIPEAGREVFFVINHGLQDFDRDNSFESLNSDISAKLNYTFRF